MHAIKVIDKNEQPKLEDTMSCFCVSEINKQI